MNKRDFSEEPILREKSIYCPKELCRSSGNCLFVGFSFGSFFIVIIPEVRGIFSYTICHNPDDSSCMRASFFRDFVLSFYFPKRMNYRDRFFKIDKTLKVHRERGRGKDGRARRESSGKGIFRNIDTTEIVNHGNTSMDGLKGIALPLNLLAEVSLRSSINQYETGRAEDRLLCESKNSGNMESRLPGLSFIRSFEKFKYHISI